VILKGFRYEFGSHFCVWSQLRQILGKEFLIEKSPESLGDMRVVRGCEVRVARRGFGTDVTGPSLKDCHPCPVRVEYAYPTCVTSEGRRQVVPRRQK